jgi:hypothetical protein
MKTTHLLILLGSLAARDATFGAEATNSAPSRTDYVSFRVISERNIFNPRRSGRATSRASTRTESERRVPMDRFALLGTMSYEKGRYAFFDGSSSDFRKVAKPADSIAGFKIMEVAPTCVKLEMTNGQVIELCVGMQMKKREDEDWQLAGKADSADGPGQASTSTSNSTASGSAQEADDVLKRLMERREQEGTPVSPASETPVAVEAAKPEETKTNAAPGESDDVLKRLLQKREQELNK